MGAASHATPSPEDVASQFTHVYYNVASTQPHRLAELFGDDSQLSHTSGSVHTGTKDIASAALSLPLANKPLAFIRSVESMHTGTGGYVLLVTGASEGTPFAQTFVLESAGGKESNVHFYCRNDIFRVVAPVSSSNLASRVASYSGKNAMKGQIATANSSDAAHLERKKESLPPIAVAAANSFAKEANQIGEDGSHKEPRHELAEMANNTGPGVEDGVQDDEEYDEDEDEDEDDEDEEYEGEEDLEDQDDLDGSEESEKAENNIGTASSSAEHMQQVPVPNSPAAYESLGSNLVNAGRSAPGKDSQAVPANRAAEVEPDVEIPVASTEGSTRVHPSHVAKGGEGERSSSREIEDSSAKASVRKSWASIVSSAGTGSSGSIAAQSSMSPPRVSVAPPITDSSSTKPEHKTPASKTQIEGKPASLKSESNGQGAPSSTGFAHKRNQASSNTSSNHGGWNSVEGKRHGTYQQHSDSGGLKTVAFNGHAGGHPGNSYSSFHNNYYSKASMAPKAFGPTAVIQLSSLPDERTKDWRALQSELNTEFSSYGHEVKHVEVKVHKGLAFVEYENIEAVRAAVAAWADGPRATGLFNGLSLSVSEKRNRRFVPASSGDRGGFSGGRGNMRGGGRGGGRGRGRGPGVNNLPSVSGDPSSFRGNLSTTSTT